jgi:hypothetical protein
MRPLSIQHVHSTACVTCAYMEIGQRDDGSEGGEKGGEDSGFTFIYRGFTYTHSDKTV